MMRRQLYSVNTSATVTDTGPSFNGAVHQVKWEVTSGGDTGDDLNIYLQQTMTDTGDGVPVLTRAATLASDFHLMPRRPTHNVAGAAVDTGDDFGEPVVSAGEHLRVRVAPGAGTVVGKLYVWTKD